MNTIGISATCSWDQFRCLDGSSCIERRWLCDGRYDCPDRSDEDRMDCLARRFLAATSTSQFSSVSKNFWTLWCLKFDRRFCTNIVERSPTCSSGQFRCTDGSSCIPMHWVCDGSHNCADSSDENLLRCRTPRPTPTTTTASATRQFTFVLNNIKHIYEALLLLQQHLLQLRCFES